MWYKNQKSKIKNHRARHARPARQSPPARNAMLALAGESSRLWQARRQARQAGNDNVKCKKAFTLIELLIVISVITIVSAIAVSSLNNYLPNTRLRGDKNMLVGDLRTAQQQAVTRQKRYIVRFDNSIPSEPKYQYILLENESEEVLLNREFSHGILIDISGVPDEEFSFGASGAPTNGGSVVLTNEKEQTKTVEVTPAGQIK